MAGTSRSGVRIETPSVAFPVPTAFEAETEIEAFPAAGGVPESSPVVALRVNHPGSPAAP